jgi:hypothetical protein
MVVFAQKIKHTGILNRVRSDCPIGASAPGPKTTTEWGIDLLNHFPKAFPINHVCIR